MFYRVVMQGRTTGGADVAAVKREFVRVTGLPVNVADDMFAGMPKVIKRKAPQADAERIAATLRAIGAATTVEREVGSNDADDQTDEGIDIIAAPLGNGPPTEAPGMAPPEPQVSAPLKKAWVRDLRDKWPIMLGTFALIGAAIYFGPELSGWVASLRPAAVAAAAPKAVARQPDAEAVAESTALNASLLHGPWRCVDQRTGLGVYWSYAADGGLVFHGDVLSDRPAQAAGSAATGWTLEGAKLLHKHAQGEVDAFKVANLTLTRLRYYGDRGLEIECRRP
jgi:Ribosomal protein L7/L12 C-terminal domain